MDMQPSGTARKSTPPPLPSSSARQGYTPAQGRIPSSNQGGGVFDDYSFRFSKTYTAVDSSGAATSRNTSGVSFGLPRQSPHGATVAGAMPSLSSTTNAQGHLGPRSMLATPDVNMPSSTVTHSNNNNNVSSSPRQQQQQPHREKRGASKKNTMDVESSLLPLQNQEQRAAIDQEAATRVMALLSNRKTITAPLSQTQKVPTSALAREAAPSPLGDTHARTAASASATSSWAGQTGMASSAASTASASHRRIPASHPLPPPVLGKAAGAVHMGSHGGQLSLSPDERTEVMNTALDPRERLFEMWQQRQQARLGVGRRRAVDQYLDRALSEAVHGLLIEEEDYWIQELSHSQMKGREISVNPNLKPYGTGTAGLASTGVRHDTSGAGGGGAKDMMSETNGLSSVGATARGITVPLTFMASLFRGLRALLHQRTVTLLTSLQTNKEVLLLQNASSADASRTGTRTDVAHVSREEEVSEALQRNAAADEKAYVDALIESETQLGQQAAKDTETHLLPSCISLPPERILGSVLSLETSTSVVLLWKILQQAQSVIPNMGFAMTLYQHYILPHVYDNYALYTYSLPHQVGSLSEQVHHLLELPLRARVDLTARAALQQATDDVAYMETAMKAWALRSWRATVLAERRLRRQRAAIEAAMTGLRRRTQVKQLFDAWRLSARESAQQTYMRAINEEYRTFLQSSGVVAQVERFPLLGTVEDGKSTAAAGARSGRAGGGTAYNRAKFLATKLAESAEHHKSGKRSPADPFPVKSNFTLPPVLSVDARQNQQQQQQQRQEQQFGKSGFPFSAGGSAVTVQRTETARGSATADVRSEGTGTADEGGEDDAYTAASAMRDTPTIGSDVGRDDATDPCRRAVGDTNSASDFTVHAFQASTTTTFDTMLSKLREMEEVCGHLQSEISIQNGRIAKLEQEKFALTDRNRTLETKLLEALDEKLHYCNVVQEKQLLLNDRSRRIAQLKSRLRAHRNRPWQKTVLRLMGELCGASTQLSETADDARILLGMKSDGRGDQPGPTSSGNTSKDSGKLLKAAADASDMGRGGGGDGNKQKEGGGTADEAEDEGEAAFATQRAEEREERRLFGRLAPVVLSTTQNLPDALVILQDWVNSCLDDLESLDDIKGGALSLRVTTFSEELRNGVLLSRLLYYLALPRYLHSNGANTSSGGGGTSGDEDGARAYQRGVRQRMAKAMTSPGGAEGGDGVDFFAPNFSERRVQLLEKRQVQLEAPFPVYSECFGDLLNMRLSDRMTLLLQFATELVMGQEAPSSESVETARVKLRNVLYTSLGLSEPPAAGRLELTEVIDPHALAMGERAASVTFLALLYTRFSHPFNHKCKQSAAMERAGILYLLSGGQWLQEECARMNVSGAMSASLAGGAGASRPSTSAAAPLSSVEQELLASLDDADKSPWQLFKERCMPVFGNSAHPFLLRGNFWPSEAFDSPDLAELLGELGMALNRSLQVHRWHVTLSCLVPVMTYSGLSRGVFTGPRTSPTALRVGLEREGQWEFPLGYEYLDRIFTRRLGGIQKALAQGQLDFAELMQAPTLEAQEGYLHYATPMGTSRTSTAHAVFSRTSGGGSGVAGYPSGSASPAGSPASASLYAEGAPAEKTTTTSDAAAAPRRATRASFFMQSSRTRRETAVGGSAASPTANPPASVLEAIRSRDQASLMIALQMGLDDLLSFFAMRATLNAELALPVMDLPGWRLFCADLQLMRLQPIVATTTKISSGNGTADEDGGKKGTREDVDERDDTTAPVRLLDMETATHIFHLAVLSHLDLDAGATQPIDRVEPRLSPAGSPPSLLSAAGSSPDLATVLASSPIGSHGRAEAGSGGASPVSSVSGRPSPTAVVVPPSPGGTAAHTVVALPTVRSYMTFPTFVVALTLVADHLYPQPLTRTADPTATTGEEDEEKEAASLEALDAPGPVAAAMASGRGPRHAVRWLGDALSCLVQRYMLTNMVIEESATSGAVFNDPRSIIARLMSGLPTQEVLNWYSPCIVAVYNAYSREVFGLSALQCEDVMRVLRDAMLTSTEISQYLITELFQHCAVTHSAQDEAVIAKRKEIDGKPREGASALATGEKRKYGRSVRIVDPRSSTTSAITAPSTDVRVLNYDGFVQLLCVLCVFKQPNPLVGFDQRLGVFLRRSLLRPLTHKVDGLSMLLNRGKMPIRGGAGGVTNGSQSGAETEVA